MAVVYLYSFVFINGDIPEDVSRHKNIGIVSPTCFTIEIVFVFHKVY